MENLSELLEYGDSKHFSGMHKLMPKRNGKEHVRADKVRKMKNIFIENKPFQMTMVGAPDYAFASPENWRRFTSEAQAALALDVKKKT
ncbi:unnamed protein product [Pieris macdunnoughi]|uniref:Uncharacterized protein n=1 Tax=Pieris macdunnoughi TaxID=345717 RepID=A0A821LH35_9NEOP|nr:unnamed protein product [Pieris macdunnoughi]